MEGVGGERGLVQERGLAGGSVAFNIVNICGYRDLERGNAYLCGLCMLLKWYGPHERVHACSGQAGGW